MGFLSPDKKIPKYIKDSNNNFIGVKVLKTANKMVNIKKR